MTSGSRPRDLAKNGLDVIKLTAYVQSITGCSYNIMVILVIVLRMLATSEESPCLFHLNFYVLVSLHHFPLKGTVDVCFGLQ